MSSLPGSPSPTLRRVWSEVPGPARGSLKDHLLNGTSADWLARSLTEAGYPIGATTIKTYRRSLRQNGV